MKRGRDPRAMARAGLWSALAFVLNLAWEIAHVRLYTIWAVGGWHECRMGAVSLHLGRCRDCARDVRAGRRHARRQGLAISRPWAGGAIVVAGAMAYTAWSEWYNVYRVGNWGYTASMPLVFGIGLSPLLQWLVLPPVMVAVYRALVLGLLGRHETQPTILTNDVTRIRP
jgi:hypothetical protein